MKHLLFYYSVALLPLLLLFSCSSSDESTQQGSQQAKADSLARRRGTNFMTNQDTVVASVTKQSKGAARSKAAADSGIARSYTVQIGAFTDPQHAVRAQRLAKEHFSDYPVFNQFEASLKLYRVSIGKFESRDDAAALLKAMTKLYPKDYAECWVNSIAR